MPADELRIAGVELAGVPALRGADGGVVVAATPHYGLRYAIGTASNPVSCYIQVSSFHIVPYASLGSNVVTGIRSEYPGI